MNKKTSKRTAQKAVYEEVKRAQDFKCFTCGAKVYFRKGEKDELGKAIRFNFDNDRVHQCLQADREVYQATAQRRRQKAYFARRRQEEGYIPRSRPGRETRQQRENREFNEREERARREARAQETREQEAREAREAQEARERRERNQRRERNHSSSSNGRSAYEDFWKDFEEKARRQEEQYQFNGMSRQKAIFVLKLEEPFNLNDLEKAKRAGYLKYHPDRNHGQNAAELFRQVTDAYNYLKRDMN